MLLMVFTARRYAMRGICCRRSLYCFMLRLVIRLVHAFYASVLCVLLCDISHCAVQHFIKFCHLGISVNSMVLLECLLCAWFHWNKRNIYRHGNIRIVWNICPQCIAPKLPSGLSYQYLVGLHDFIEWTYEGNINIEETLVQLEM